MPHPRLELEFVLPRIPAPGEINPRRPITEEPPNAAITSLDLQAGEDGITTVQYSVLGDSRAHGRRGGISLTLRLRQGEETLRETEVTGLIGRGGAVLDRARAGSMVTRLSASTRPGDEATLPDVAPWVTVKTVSRRGAKGKVRTFEVRHASVNAVVRAAAAAAGGSAAAAAPWSEALALTWVVETTPRQVPGEPPRAPYTTEGKTFSAVLNELWPGQLGYFIRWQEGAPHVHRRELGDTVYDAPVLSETIEEIDYDSPRAVIVRGSEVQRDPLTGLYIVSLEMSGDPGAGELEIGGEGPASVTEVSTTTTTLTVSWTPAPGAAEHEVLLTGGPEDLRWTVEGTELTVDDLTPGTTYTVAVRGVIRGGNLTARTQWSPQAQIQLERSGDWPDGSQVIRSLSARESDSERVQLSWGTASEFAPEGGFTLARTPALPGGPVTLGGAVSSWTDQDAGTGTRTYTLTAASADGHTSEPISVTVDVSQGRPSAPEHLAVTPVGTNLSVTLSPARRASSYRLLVRRGEATLIDVTLPDNATGTGDRTFTLPAADLERATSHTLWVYPLSSDGTGPGVSEEFVTPAALTGSVSIPRDGTVTFALPVTFADGSSMTETHTVTSAGGRVTQRQVTTTVSAQRRAAGAADAAATQVLYSGRTSVQTVDYAYGLTRAPESRLPEDVERIATQIRTVTQKYGPDLTATPPSSSETLLSTEGTLEILRYSTGTGYLDSKTTTTTVTSSLSTMLSGTTSVTETHTPMDGGRWLHTVTQRVSRLVTVLDSAGAPAGYTTDEHTTPRSEVSTTPPDRLPWTGDTDPGLIVDEAPEFRTDVQDGAEDLQPDIPGISVQLEGRVNLPGRGSPLELSLPFLYSQSSMQYLADQVAARLGRRRRVTRTYLAPVPASLTDPGVLRYSMQISDRGAPRVQVTTEGVASDDLAQPGPDAGI